MEKGEKNIVVLTGDTGSRKMLSILQQYGWGRMFVQRMRQLYDGEPWGFDNGAYIDWVHGREFDCERFDKFLHEAYKWGVPYLAVCPDKVAQGETSLEFSLSFMRFVLPQDWPWYLAVQNGMTTEMVEPHLEKFAGIFLGGNDQFKAAAPEWCELAHKHGKKFHYARINPRRLIVAKQIGADSVDGTGLLWEQEKFDKFVKTFYSEAEPMSLFG